MTKAKSETAAPTTKARDSGKEKRRKRACHVCRSHGQRDRHPE